MAIRFDRGSEKELFALQRATREIKRATKEAERERKRLESAHRWQHFVGFLDRLRGTNDLTPEVGVAGYLLRAQARVLDEIRRPGRPEKGNEFVRESSGWRMSFDGRTIRVPDWKGFAHLHALIAHQGNGLACTGLLTIADGVDPDAEGIAPEDGLGSGSVRPARDRRTADAHRKGMQEIQEASEAADACHFSRA